MSDAPENPATAEAIGDARQQLPDRPGHPVEPFGYTTSEGKALGQGSQARSALGRAPRQFRATSGATTKRPNETLPRIERLCRAVGRLADDDLDRIAAAIEEERTRRKTQ